MDAPREPLPPWKRLSMYLAFGSTAVVGTGVGGLMIVAPEISRRILGFPTELPPTDPVIYGMLAAIWIAVGLKSIPALWDPTSNAALLKIQITYKTIWIAAVALPVIQRGHFPDYGWTLLVGNCVWIGMDLLAMPWNHRVRPIGTSRPTADDAAWTSLHRGHSA